MSNYTTTPAIFLCHCSPSVQTPPECGATRAGAPIDLLPSTRRRAPRWLHRSRRVAAPHGALRSSGASQGPAPRPPAPSSCRCGLKGGQANLGPRSRASNWRDLGPEDLRIIWMTWLFSREEMGSFFGSFPMKPGNCYDALRGGQWMVNEKHEMEEQIINLQNVSW